MARAHVRDLLENELVGRHVLLVDDDQTVRQMLSTILGRLGLVVLPAENAQAALAIFDKFKNDIELAICDFMMPGMPGDELFALLRQAKPELKGLMVTGLPPADCLRTFRAAGVDGYLAKPFGIDELEQALRRVLALA